MSRWTTFPISLIYLILSVGAASSADDVPRNIELKPGAAATDNPPAADQSATGIKTRQIATEGKGRSICCCACQRSGGAPCRCGRKARHAEGG